MTPSVLPLEQVTLVAPLGLRFWDVAAQTPAELGLVVTSYPSAIPELRSTAVWHASGIYSFSNLPGLRLAENGAGDDAYWNTNRPSLPYTVEVADPQNRYLPFKLSMPLPQQGLFRLAGSPPISVQTPDATWIPIFSTPARSAAGVSGVIRAELRDASDAGAPGAVITARPLGGPPSTGVADQRGIVSLPLPYPELRTAPLGSPLGPTPLKLSDQSWPVEVRVFFDSKPTAQVPDLEELFQQREAFVWRDNAQSATVNTFTLRFGRDLILRSLDSSSGRELPHLLITAEGSPL